MKYTSTKKFINDLKPFVGEDNSNIKIEISLINDRCLSDYCIDYCEWKGKKFKLISMIDYQPRLGYDLSYAKDFKLFLKEIKDKNIEKISSKDISCEINRDNVYDIWSDNEFEGIEWETPLTSEEDEDRYIVPSPN